jgi:TetR/AcrR family transcriptional regulator, mexJK operon transcriptional repressor
MATGRKQGLLSSKTRPSRGRPPLDDIERKRILDAAAAVFLEKGFQRASTNEIARRAQASKHTLYKLFATKADLFAGVMSVHTEQLYAQNMYYIASDKTPCLTLTEIGCKTLHMFSAPEFLALYRILVAEAQNFPELARLLWCECMERGRNLLAEYLQTRRIGGPDYRQSAAQFISFVLGDFVINAMLNPDLQLSERIIHTRVRGAVKDFLQLHPAQPAEKPRCSDGVCG